MEYGSDFYRNGLRGENHIGNLLCFSIYLRKFAVSLMYNSGPCRKYVMVRNDKQLRYRSKMGNL